LSYRILQGDVLEQLATLPDESVDAVVTDPPYEMRFMGKAWDGSGISTNVAMWSDCLRVLKPGGHLLAFSGARTLRTL
jgi:DNA modification methylase